MSRMRFLQALFGAFLLFTAALVPAAQPQVPAAQPPASARPQAAAAPVDAAPASAGLDLLRQASEAWRAGNFRGRFVYVRGNRMDSMQVVHAVFDGVEHERLSHLDNSTAEIIRRGNETISIHPDARMTRFDSVSTGGPFRAFAALAGSVSQYYEVRRAALSRVAGRSADFVDVGPRDIHRYGYRLWVDRETRLPLRYEVVNRRGMALESVEFVDVETGISVPREMFTPPVGADGGVVALTLLRSTEAPMPAVAPSWLPPGFSVTGSQTQKNGEFESSAVTYSDGLAAFSVFVEKAGSDAKPMGRQIGPTVAVSGVLDAASAGRFRVTLVGEVPAGTAVKIVESARHRLKPGAPAADTLVAPPAIPDTED